MKTATKFLIITAYSFLVITGLAFLTACQSELAHLYFSPVRALVQNGFTEIPLPIQQVIYIKKNKSEHLNTNLRPKNSNVKILYIYIEGDGAPWFQSQYPPNDPTPKTSTVIQLAISHHSNNVAYLGRACQYLNEISLEQCRREWWTNERFSSQVISMSQLAIEAALNVSGADKIVLIGYSGGGTLATLIATQRSDVECIVTLASPLDIQAWTHIQGLKPLIGSLNPADYSQNLLSIRQNHYMGAEDKVVPVGSLGRYKLTSPHQIYTILDGVGHTIGWSDQFEKIKKESCLSKLNRP